MTQAFFFYPTLKGLKAAVMPDFQILQGIFFNITAMSE